MSKTKLLLDLVTDIRSVADDLEAIIKSATDSEAAAVEAAGTLTDPTEVPASTMSDTVPPTSSIALKPNERIDPETGEIVCLDLPALRALAASKTQTREQTAQMKALLQKHGVDRLSKLPLSDYFIFQQEVEAIV